MELQIRGRGIPITDEIRQFADKRAARLERLIGPIIDAKLELRADNNRVGPSSTTAQLTIQTGRRLLRAEERDPEPKAAIDRAIDKLDRQIRRVHDRRSVSKTRQTETIRTPPLPPEPDALFDEVEGDGAESGAGQGLVRTKRFSLKPMDVDEAIEQMELLGHDFYLFQNAVENNFSVVYRRRDGAYGLLIPD
ncbi:MAG TPA: ribosome-associated translation inhibitor RaiA [Thermomicrobiales bacterium]|nr:ribosome-associated translation inhibitor RaiA [Thermomicrobiales bacterium]